MMSDNSSFAPVQPSQYNPMQRAQVLGDHLPPGIDSTSPYPAMNYVNAFPPTRYTDNMGYDDPPHLATGPAGQENQGQCQFERHRTPGITLRIPIAPGPPQLEQYPPAIPGVPNDGPPSHVPPPHNIAGPSRGNPSIVRSGMSVGEDLKNMASQFLHNPGSHVNKFRMRRSRSGAVKVLILLEIDDIV